MKIKHVYGNVLKLDIPLTIKIRTLEDDVPTEREEPFYPDVSKGCVVVLNNNYNRKMEYNASLSGNVAHIEDDGVIGIGTYKVTVKCYDEYGNPYRYMVRDIIEICDATIDAGIEAGVEFNAETYTLEGAVFVSYGGEQVQSDWAETDPEEKSFIKNKPDLSVYATKNELREVEREIPTLPDHIVTDEHYVHTDNNYTSVEKEKLAELENYDDSEIRQELDGKVDKVAGKGLSTNDFTNEDKSKLNSALQSETDPTVPSWAKTPTKPAYDYSEIANTPSIPTNTSDLNNNSGFITNSVNNLVNYYLKSETYTKTEVGNLIAAIQQFHYEIYASTSDVTSPAGNVLYLIGPTGTGSDKYEEYVYDSTKQEPWVKIGDTSIDLSGYVTTTALNTALADYTTTANLTTLLAGKQNVIDATHKLSADLVDDTNSTHKFVTAQEKQDWNNKSDFSGSYNDLSDKPTIPTALSQLNEDSTHRTVSDTEKTTWGNKQEPLVSGTNIKTINNESLLGGGNISVAAELPSNLAYISNDDGEGIIPSDGIRAVTVTSAAAMTINPDVVTVINGAVGTATITLQVPNDNLAHVWDILMTTDSTVAITFAISNSATILYPSGFSVGASKAVEVSVIGVGTKYYLRYGEFA